MPIQIYDIVMLAVLVLTMLFGLWKGMAWQLASLGSLVISCLVAMRLSGPLAPYISDAEPWNRFIAMLALYLATSLAIWLLFRLVAGAIDRVHLREFDRQLGALFGLLKGALLCLVITFFAVTLSETARQAVLASKSGELIAKFIQRATPAMPDEVREVLGKYIEQLDRKLDPDTPAADPETRLTLNETPLAKPETPLGGLFSGYVDPSGQAPGDQSPGERFKSEIKQKLTGELNTRVDDGFNRLGESVNSFSGKIEDRFNDGFNRVDEGADSFSNEVDERIDDGFNRIDKGAESLTDKIQDRVDKGTETLHDGLGRLDREADSLTGEVENQFNKAAGALPDTVKTPMADIFNRSGNQIGTEPGRLADTVDKQIDNTLNRAADVAGRLESEVGKLGDRVDTQLESGVGRVASLGLGDGPGPLPQEPPGLTTMVALPGYHVTRGDVLKIKSASTVGESIDGLYRVDSDGTVDLRRHGKVAVADRRLGDVERLIEQQLSQSAAMPDVSLDVAPAEANVYYIVATGTGQGDSVLRVPAQGADSVESAVRLAAKVDATQIEKIWIARPSTVGDRQEQLIPIEWNTGGRFASPNQPVAPGDAVFISGRKQPSPDNVRQWVSAWFERIRR